MKSRQLCGAELRREYEAGATLEALAGKYGSFLNTIADRLRLAGTAIRPAGVRKGTIVRDGTGSRKLPMAMLPVVLAAFDRGEALAAIGARHGITRERVRQIASLAGRTPRRIQQQQQREAA